MKKYYPLLLFVVLIILKSNSYGQNVALNDNGATPDTSAMLDISSTTKGLLTPRMTTAQRNSIPLPATGLLVYNTTTGAFNVNTGTSASPVWDVLSLASGGGITSMGGLTGATQTFATGTSGTNFAISSSGTTHTFNLPDASATARGVLTTAAQTLAGNKTFSGNTTLSGTLTASTLAGGASTDSIVTVNASTGLVNKRRVADVLSGTAITSINSLTGSSQTITAGTSGTDFAVSSSGTTHTLNLPSASATARGLVTTAAQTLAGNKTFSGNTTLSGTLTASTLAGGASTDSIVTVNASTGLVNKRRVVDVINASAWATTGNSATTASSSAIGSAANNNFIGTTDARDFVTATSGFERMRITSTGNIGIQTTPAAGNLLDITSSAVGSAFNVTTGNVVNITGNGLTTGTGLNVSSTGTITSGGEIAQFTGNSATTGNILALSGTGLTTGSVISATAGTTTGSAVNITSNGLTTGTGLNVSSTGTITSGGEVAQFTGNSATTGNILSLSGTGLTSGSAISATAGTTTGNAVNITSNGLTTGNGLNVSSTGTVTSGGSIAQFIGNSVTTGNILTLFGTGLTSGSAISATAGTSTGNAVNITSNGLTTGTGLRVSSTSTLGTGSGSSYLINIARSGANANASHFAYGIASAVTNTGTTSTNIAGYFSASGASNNYGVIVPSTGGRSGFGTTTPAQEVHIGGTANTLRIDGIATGNTYNSSSTAATSNILYTNNSTGDVYALPTVNSATLVTSSTGVPSWAATGLLVSASRTSAYTPTVAYATLAYNSASINVGTAYNTTTGVFTAPATGTYQFIVNNQYRVVNALNNGVAARLIVNGATDMETAIALTPYNTLTIANTITLNSIVTMTSGQTAYIQIGDLVNTMTPYVGTGQHVFKVIRIK